jgi:tail collar domain
MKRTTNKPTLSSIILSIKGVMFGALLTVAVITQAMSQATLLPNASQQYFDDQGVPVAGGTIDYYIPGTTTRKNTWQDAAQTQLNTNPIVLNSGGHPPATPSGSSGTYGSGAYRQVLKKSNGTVVWDRTTASTDGSGGTTTVGDGDLVGTIKPWAGIIAPAQYMFTSGAAIARTTYPDLMTAITQLSNVVCTSGSPTLTGIADTTQLPVGANVEANCLAPGATVLSTTTTTVTLSANATVSTSTTARFFPWGNGNGSTSFNLPDSRGRTFVGRQNQGAPTVAAATRLTTAFYGSNPDAIGSNGGLQTSTLSIANLASHNHSVFLNDLGHVHGYGPSALINLGGTGSPNTWAGTSASTFNTASAFSNVSIWSGASGTGTANQTANSGSGTAFANIPPSITVNYIIKVTPDVSSAVASGVASIQGMTGVLLCGAGLNCTGNVIDTVAAVGGTVKTGVQNQLAYYDSSTSVLNIGSLGTTTTVLHGNPSGPPAYGSVALGTDVSGTLQAPNFPILSGDITTPGASLVTTLATVNANVGAFGSATNCVTFTVNAKGLITAASQATCTPALGSITGFGTGVATALGNAVSTAGGVALILAKGTMALGTSAISANTCGTATTTTATGIASTDIVDIGWQGDPTAVTGYTPSASVTLYGYFSTTNTVAIKQCNFTGSSITPSALTVNWAIRR